MEINDLDISVHQFSLEFSDEEWAALEKDVPRALNLLKAPISKHALFKSCISAGIKTLLRDGRDKNE